MEDLFCGDDIMKHRRRLDGRLSGMSTPAGRCRVVGNGNRLGCLTARRFFSGEQRSKHHHDQSQLLSSCGNARPGLAWL